MQIRVQPKSALLGRKTPQAWQAFKTRVVAAKLGSASDDAVNLSDAAPRQLMGVRCVPRCQHVCSLRFYSDSDDRCRTIVDRAGLFQGRKMLLSVDVSSGHTIVTAVIEDLGLVADLVDAIGAHKSRPWEVFDAEGAADASADSAQSLA